MSRLRIKSQCERSTGRSNRNSKRHHAKCRRAPTRCTPNLGPTRAAIITGRLLCSPYSLPSPRCTRSPHWRIRRYNTIYGTACRWPSMERETSKSLCDVDRSIHEVRGIRVVEGASLVLLCLRNRAWREMSRADGGESNYP